LLDVFQGYYYAHANEKAWKIFFSSQVLGILPKKMVVAGYPADKILAWNDGFLIDRSYPLSFDMSMVATPLSWDPTKKAWRFLQPS